MVLTMTKPLYDGKKIASLMAEKGLSMNRVAKLAGISVPAVHHLVHEHTKDASLRTLKGVAEALGVPLQAILRDQPVDSVTEITTLFEALTPANRGALLGAASALLQAQRKK